MTPFSLNALSMFVCIIFCDDIFLGEFIHFQIHANYHDADANKCTHM